MAGRNCKSKQQSLVSVKSQYKYVAGSHTATNKTVNWYVNKKGVAKTLFSSEREAALAVDKYLISKGLAPVNILKKKAD